MPLLRSRHPGMLALLAAGCTALVAGLYGLRLTESWWERPFLQKPLPAALGRVLLKLGGSYRRVEWRTTGSLHRYGRKGTLPPEVVFLPIDNLAARPSDLFEDERRNLPPALAQMSGGFPFPRTLYPLIVERLVRAGARVVAFDMRFPSANTGDEEFAAALEKYAEHVIIGSNLTYEETDFGNKPSLEAPSTSLIPSGSGYDGRLGFVNFRPEPEDDKVHASLYRTTLLEYFQGIRLEEAPVLWSMAAQMARKAGHEALVPAEHAPQEIRFVEDLHPISVHDIFVERLWSHPPLRNGEFFRDKIVLIGPYGNWIKDVVDTPLGLMLGPQIHLSALASVLNQDFLRSTSVQTDFGLIFLAGLLAWLVGAAIPHPLWRCLVLPAVVAAYLGTALWLFNEHGRVLKLFSPSLAFASSAVVGLVWERVVETRERTRTRRTLERYVSRDVVREVLDNPESYLNTLAGVSRKPITLLFSDVRGFTTLTESGDAEKLVQQLNEYFTEMVRIVFSYHGTLDKFMGDAVMASWGALVSEGPAPDARHAVSAALDMLHALKRLNAGWKERGLLELQIGLGVNHGEAICGNLGSEEKREFTAIGDAVNTASRLEGATKQFHVDLLIGELTAPLVRETHTVRSVDLLQVKGKTRPVEVFTVLDLRGGQPVPPWLEPYEEGLRYYRQRAFPEAERLFAAAAALAPEDWLTGEYLRRTRAYLAEPPPPEWDGVFVMTSK